MEHRIYGKKTVKVIPSKARAQRGVIMAALFPSRNRQFNISRFKTQQARKAGRSFSQARTLCKSPPKKCALYSSHLNDSAITATCLIIEVVIIRIVYSETRKFGRDARLCKICKPHSFLKLRLKWETVVVSKYIAGYRSCKYEFLNIHEESVGVGSCLLCVSCSRMPKTLCFPSCLHKLEMFAHQLLYAINSFPRCLVSENMSFFLLG